MDLQVLIVEDQLEAANLLKLRIERIVKKSKVIVTTNGFDALDKLRENAFDLVITDYRMPGMDGLELVEAIRGLSPNTEIVVNSAFASKTLDQLINQAQIKYFLRKPFSQQDIYPIIEQVMASIKVVRKKLPPLITNKTNTSAKENITQQLKDLRYRTGASCCLLVDEIGHLLAESGGDQQLSLSVIASVAAASALITAKTSHLIGNSAPFDSIMHEGPTYNVATYIMDNMNLLVIIFNKTVKIGLVQHYARRSLTSLSELLQPLNATSVQPSNNTKLVASLKKSINTSANELLQVS